jgi:hypothetical protein
MIKPAQLKSLSIAAPAGNAVSISRNSSFKCHHAEVRQSSSDVEFKYWSKALGWEDPGYQIWYVDELAASICSGN